MKSLPKKLQEKRDARYDRMSQGVDYHLGHVAKDAYNACWADVSEAVQGLENALEDLLGRYFEPTKQPWDEANKSLTKYRDLIWSESDE